MNIPHLNTTGRLPMGSLVALWTLSGVGQTRGGGFAARRWNPRDPRQPQRLPLAGGDAFHCVPLAWERQGRGGIMRPQRFRYGSALFVMRGPIVGSLLGVMAAVGLAWGQHSDAGQKSPEGLREASPHPPAAAPAKPAEDPPLLLEDDGPLLLLDDAPAIALPAGLVADNTRCKVCHLGVFLEELSVTHAKANISCARCHGDCDEHIADESWASGGNGTAPERMYRRHTINAMCRDCHKESKRAAQKSGPPCPKLSGQSNTSKTCTACHGSHRQAVRRCTWK